MASCGVSCCTSLSHYYDRRSINYISDMCIARNNEIPLIRLYTCQRMERVHTNRFNRTWRVRRPEHRVGWFEHSVLYTIVVVVIVFYTCIQVSVLDTYL